MSHLVGLVAQGVQSLALFTYSLSYKLEFPIQPLFSLQIAHKVVL